MINYDSIISAYNDKPTLMEWLKKVEEALKGASATSFSVNKKGNATISFQINFDDGTSLESGDIVLQQGESVTGASIVNGHLILTLSNGDNLDAGNLGAVSGFSIDASQHLIVTYQDGTSFDLGAIFNGNVNISGVLSASSVSTPLITSAGASVEFGKPIDVDVLTSSEDSIAARKPIVETMTGYSFSNGIIKYITPNYAGAVKNGNKLTLAMAGLINVPADGEYSQYTDMGSVYFIIPASIYSLIVGIGADGNTGALDCRIITAFKLYNEKFQVNALVTKNSAYSGSVKVQFLGMDNQTIARDTNYAVRIELTILLGTNLAA